MENDTDQAKQPFHVTLDQRMTERQITDEALGARLGYQKPNAIAMMRTGQMRMPLHKVLALAQALDLPARELFEALMHESMPEVLEVMRAVYDPMERAPTEIYLIKHLCNSVGGVFTIPGCGVQQLGCPKWGSAKKAKAGRSSRLSIWCIFQLVSVQSAYPNRDSALSVLPFRVKTRGYKKGGTA